MTAPDEVTFESGVFLLLKEKARAITAPLRPEPGAGPEPGPRPEPGSEPISWPGPELTPERMQDIASRTFRISGNVPPEVWNRLGTKILPKLRSGSDLKIGIEFSVTIDSSVAQSFEMDLKQILEDLGISGDVRIY